MAGERDRLLVLAVTSAQLLDGLVELEEHASSAVVAEEITVQPAALTRSTSLGSGKPKWKLTTGGLNDSSTCAASALNGERVGPAGIAPSIPYSW